MCYHDIQEGGVSLLRFSPAESALAVCSGGDHVILWDLNLAEQGMAKVGLPWSLDGHIMVTYLACACVNTL